VSFVPSQSSLAFRFSSIVLLSREASTYQDKVTSQQYTFGLSQMMASHLHGQHSAFQLNPHPCLSLRSWQIYLPGSVRFFGSQLTLIFLTLLIVHRCSPRQKTFAQSNPRSDLRISCENPQGRRISPVRRMGSHSRIHDTSCIPVLFSGLLRKARGGEKSWFRPIL